MARYAWDIENASSPGPEIVLVTPSDTEDQQTQIGNEMIIGFRALRANTAGTITVTMKTGTARTLTWGAGETKPGCFVRVWANRTTATGIEGFV